MLKHQHYSSLAKAKSVESSRFYKIANQNYSTTVSEFLMTLFRNQTKAIQLVYKNLIAIITKIRPMVFVRKLHRANYFLLASIFTLLAIVTPSQIAQAAKPTVTTGSATIITRETATVSGSVPGSGETKYLKLVLNTELAKTMVKQPQLHPSYTAIKVSSVETLSPMASLTAQMALPQTAPATSTSSIPTTTVSKSLYH